MGSFDPKIFERLSPAKRGSIGKISVHPVKAGIG
jgi:hypothetical protein